MVKPMPWIWHQLMGFAIGGAIVLTLLTWAHNHDAGVMHKQWQKACVEHRAAHWETASDGSTTFVWNEEKSDG